MNELYDKLFAFLVFSHGNELARITKFSPVDAMILDDLEQAGAHATMRLLVLDEEHLQDSGFSATVTLDENGNPKDLKLSQCKRRSK